MQLSVYFQTIEREDGSYVFVIKSKGNNVPIAVSAHSYSSLVDCDQAKGVRVLATEPRYLNPLWTRKSFAGWVK